MFTLIYVMLFGLFVYLLNKKIQHGPDVDTDQSEPGADSPSSRLYSSFSTIN
jgi:cytochrome d ubiquinol oxidase subunit I